MQPELSLSDASAFIDEATGILCEAIGERDAICVALGLDLDVEVGELATAAQRMVDAHDAQERLASQMIDVATDYELDVRALRASLRDIVEEATGMRGVLHEAMGVVGIDPGQLDAVSDFVGRLHVMREQSNALRSHNEALVGLLSRIVGEPVRTLADDDGCTAEARQ